MTRGDTGSSGCFVINRGAKLVGWKVGEERGCIRSQWGARWDGGGQMGWGWATSGLRWSTVWNAVPGQPSSASAGQAVEQPACSCPVGGNATWHSQSVVASCKVKHALPFHPATPLLGIYLEKWKRIPAHSNVGICVAPFLQAPNICSSFLARAKHWTQCTCPPVGEWM